MIVSARIFALSYLPSLIHDTTDSAIIRISSPGMLVVVTALSSVETHGGVFPIPKNSTQVFAIGQI
jgi:hypothetical protein